MIECAHCRGAPQKGNENIGENEGQNESIIVPTDIYRYMPDNRAAPHIIFFKDGMVCNNFENNEQVKDFIKRYVRKYFIGRGYHDLIAQVSTATMIKLVPDATHPSTSQDKQNMQ